MLVSLNLLNSIQVDLYSAGNG